MNETDNDDLGWCRPVREFQVLGDPLQQVLKDTMRNKTPPFDFGLMIFFFGPCG